MAKHHILSTESLVYGTLLGILPDAKIPVLFVAMDQNADRIRTKIALLATKQSEIYTMHAMVKMADDYSLSTNVPAAFLEAAYAGLSEALSSGDVPDDFAPIVEEIMSALDARLKVIITDLNDIEELSFDDDPVTQEINAMAKEHGPLHPLMSGAVEDARSPTDMESHEILSPSPKLPERDPGILNTLTPHTPACSLPTRR